MGRRTFREILDGPANAITVNKDGTRMAVVGRNGKFLIPFLSFDSFYGDREENKSEKREKLRQIGKKISRWKEKEKSVDGKREVWRLFHSFPT